MHSVRLIRKMLFFIATYLFFFANTLFCSEIIDRATLRPFLISSDKSNKLSLSGLLKRADILVELYDELTDADKLLIFVNFFGEEILSSPARRFEEEIEVWSFELNHKNIQVAIYDAVTIYFDIDKREELNELLKKNEIDKIVIGINPELPQGSDKKDSYMPDIRKFLRTDPMIQRWVKNSKAVILNIPEKLVPDYKMIQNNTISEMDYSQIKHNILSIVWILSAL